MTITLNPDETKAIIRNLLNNQDHRDVVQKKINNTFFEYVIDFFKRVFEAKMRQKEITEDWYKAEFLNHIVKKEDLIINSGLNAKTIENMYGNQRKATVIIAIEQHYKDIHAIISNLIANADGLEIQLTIKIGVMSAELTLSETLIIVNTLAVKRAEIVGGAWSAVGKQVEKPLATALCRLFSVPSENYLAVSGENKNNREVDFYLFSSERKQYEGEIKLMGKGNPESIDGALARDSEVFIAATISAKGKNHANNKGMLWVELHSENGYRKFYDILLELNIPCADFEGTLNERLDVIFETLFE